MPSIGTRCHELRIQDESRSWRLFYRIDTDAIVVILWTEKKTNKTPDEVIDLCRKRLKIYDAEAYRMEKAKRERLQKKGWKVGDVDEFLGLSPAEMAIVEMKASLAKALIAKRKACGETQVSAAAMAKTSQSRYAKVEHADPSVSLELMIKMFFSLGADKKELLKALSA